MVTPFFHIWTLQSPKEVHVIPVAIPSFLFVPLINIKNKKILDSLVSLTFE